MTNKPTSDESAPDETPIPAPAMGDDLAAEDGASTDGKRRITLEELKRELAAEPILELSDDDSGDPAAVDDADRPGKAVRALSQVERTKFGYGYPALNNFAALESLTRGPALNNFATLQEMLKGPAFNFSQRDLVPGLEAVMKTPALLDWKGASGLADLNDIVAKFANSNHALTAVSALDGLDTRTNLLNAMATIDAGSFRQAHLGNLAAAMTALDVNKTLLGGLAANAGIYETLGQFVISRQSSLLADFADQWSQQMLSQVEARELLLIKATTADPMRPLLSARPLTAFNRYLDGLPLDDTDGARVRDILAAGRTHGFAVDAFVASDALLSPLMEEDRDEVIEVVETVIVEPWQEARTDAGAHLRTRLAAVDPKLEEMYLGAWEHLNTKQSGYLESSSHLANEVLGRTLRQLAPDHDVRAWADQNGLRGKDIESQNGQLTRKIRLRYIMRNASRDERNLLVFDVEAFLKATELLVGRLNAGKHDSIGTEMTLRANLVAFEAVMLRILD